MTDFPNILIDELPVVVEVAGREHKIWYDFRPALRTILAFEDNSLIAEEKITIMLQNLYIEMPDNIEAAVLGGRWFLNAGADPPEDEDATKLFSFRQDAALIYAAFRSTHGIDLETVSDLHWWKFFALFMDLGSNTAFCNLTAFRKRVDSGTATPEERLAAEEMGSAFKVEQIDTRTWEEKEQARIFDTFVDEATRK